MLGAVMFGHQQMQIAINAINELAAEAGKPSRGTGSAGRRTKRMIAALADAIGDKLSQAFQVRDKLSAATRSPAIKKDVHAVRSPAEAEAERLDHRATWRRNSASSNTRPCATRVLKTKVRIDGRQLDTVRPITVARQRAAAHRTARRCSPAARRRRSSRSRSAPRATARSSTPSQASTKDHFLFHYNFPPYLGRRSRSHDGSEASRDRPRPPRQARRARRDADDGIVPVHDPRRLGNHRVERFLVDGLGLRHRRWR